MFGVVCFVPLLALGVSERAFFLIATAPVVFTGQLQQLGP